MLIYKTYTSFIAFNDFVMHDFIMIIGMILEDEKSNIKPLP